MGAWVSGLKISVSSNSYRVHCQIRFDPTDLSLMILSLIIPYDTLFFKPYSMYAFIVLIYTIRSLGTGALFLSCVYSFVHSSNTYWADTEFQALVYFYVLYNTWFWKIIGVKKLVGRGENTRELLWGEEGGRRTTGDIWGGKVGAAGWPQQAGAGQEVWARFPYLFKW